ncbi:MAG TPA: hypothetical protein VFU72_07960 [Nitrolancea sp.]|nr:hypothetical protein [Nitrolancea sp.]
MTRLEFTACRFCGEPMAVQSWAAEGARVCLDCSFRMHLARKRYESETSEYRRLHADELAEQRRLWRAKRDRRAERNGEDEGEDGKE